jgi:hypothetical protein
MEIDKDKIWWLKNVFEAEYLGKTLRGKTLEAYLTAEKLLTGRGEIQPRGCTCEYKSLAANVHGMLSQLKDTNPEYHKL